MAVNTTALTYTQIHALTTDRYGESCPAAALAFSVGGTMTGLRVEASEIRKQLADNVEFGRDIEGVLFFDDLEEFEDVRKYNVFFNPGVPDEERAVVIQFFTGMQDQFYAQFVGRDTTKSVNCIIDGTTSNRTAVGNDLNVGTAGAYARKPVNNRTVTIDMESIGKRVTFRTSENAAKHGIYAFGSLSFKSLKDIQHNTITYVDYNNERIAFYPTDHSQTQVAYFIPQSFRLEDDLDFSALGNHASLASGASTEQLATWKDI